MATAATNTNSIQATVRETNGKNVARRVRVSGKLPATIYGAGAEAVSIAVEPRQVAAILHSASGHNTIIDVELDGASTKAMIVDWQNEPIKGHLLHVDFKRIAMDKMLTVSVPVLLKGEPAGVKLQGGILEQVIREIEIECLPTDIPTSLDVDVTELVFGQVLRVKDLPHGGTLTFLTDEEQAVAHIVAVKEAPAAAAEPGVEAAATAEPEVIKKGKTDEVAPAAESKGKK